MTTTTKTTRAQTAKANRTNRAQPFVFALRPSPFALHESANPRFGESADLATARTTKRRKRTQLTAKTKRKDATERTKALRKAQTGRSSSTDFVPKYTAQNTTEPPSTSTALRTEASPLTPTPDALSTSSPAVICGQKFPPKTPRPQPKRHLRHGPLPAATSPQTPCHSSAYRRHTASRLSQSFRALCRVSALSPLLRPSAFALHESANPPISRRRERRSDESANPR